VRRGYAFSGTWTVDAHLSHVHGVLLDLEHYPEWWPQVRAVASLGVDRARVLCRSTLPYTLDLVVHAVRREPERLEVRITGDLDGMARWRLTELGRRTRLDFAQEVTVGGWLAAVSPFVRPALRWNHAQMMRGCMEGLRGRLTA
jgi:carbon monoxide dehydrogenase subunit G